MKRNERIFRHCLCFLLAICCIVPVCSGCRRQEERRNLGVDDGIESFLFNFDSRDEVAALVKDVKRGVIPQSLSWHYDQNIMAKKNHQVPLRFTDDAEIISDVYYALGDAIVVGIAGSQTSKTPIDLTFTLQDGTDCTFRFAMENTIRISGQNYILEANGRLWNLLSEASAETESDAAETESEAIETESESAETESEAAETESEHPAQIKN